MRVIVLTTETPHHLYFVKEISTVFNIIGIAVESRVLKAPFQTHHSFEYSGGELLDRFSEDIFRF